jgi:hypothetical protein
MDVMSSSGKTTTRDELERIEDALAESLLDAAGEEVRKEIAESGGNPDALVAVVDTAFASARAASARARLERFRAELSAWQTKGGPVSPLERLRSGTVEPDAKMMMVARKGTGLSDNDLEGVIEDMAELERLERNKDDERRSG